MILDIVPLSEEFVILGLFLGIGIGTVASIVGLGGGILIIPASIFLLGFDPKSAIVVSLFAMTGLTISASISYMRQKMVNYRLAMLYNIWDIPGVILGGMITLYIAGNILAGICGSIIVFMAILLYRKKADPHGHGEKTKTREEEMSKLEMKKGLLKTKEVKSKLDVDNPYLASLSSFSGGLITGLAGLGGGTADTTSMILLGMEPKKAAATSEFAMASTSFIGVFTHLVIGTYTGSLMWPIFICIGTVTGAQIGAYLSAKMDNTVIRKVLACLAFYTGVLLILLMFGVGWSIQ